MTRWYSADSHLSSIITSRQRWVTMSWVECIGWSTNNEVDLFVPPMLPRMFNVLFSIHRKHFPLPQDIRLPMLLNSATSSKCNCFASIKYARPCWFSSLSLSIRRNVARATLKHCESTTRQRRRNNTRTETHPRKKMWFRLACGSARLESCANKYNSVRC